MNAAIPGLCSFVNPINCAACGHSSRLHLCYLSMKCQDASCNCKQFMLEGRIQKTEEKHITYDMVKQKFRVVVKGKHVCYTQTMEEAKRQRDHHLLLKGLT